jgi:hypothetical protein
VFIKRPRKGERNTYALVINGKTFHDPRIDAVNKDYAAGRPEYECLARMKAIRDSFKAKSADLLPSNEAIVQELHNKKLAANPHLSRPDDLLGRLLSAVRQVGDLPLREASTGQIIMSIKHVTDPSRRFEVIRAINEVLKFTGRADLIKNRTVPVSSRVGFISVADFKRSVVRLPQDYQLVLGALFATGARFGELPLAEITDASVFIKAQIKDDGSVGRTKNKKARRSPVLPPLQRFSKAYSALPVEAKRALRLEHYDRLYGACKRTLGIRIHDLRHSYAMEWKEVGMSFATIGGYIGDTEGAVRKYLQHAASDEMVDFAIQRYKQVKG